MPKKRNVISLQDMKRCRMTPIFFDTFFNLEKYLDHEQRDPFASNRDVDEDGNEVKKSLVHLLYAISFGCTLVQKKFQSPSTLLSSNIKREPSLHSAIKIAVLYFDWLKSSDFLFVRSYSRTKK